MNGLKIYTTTRSNKHYSSKKSKKSFSDLSGQSIFHEMKRNIRDSYKYDAFEQVGQLNAIVLEVIETDVTKMLWRNPLMSLHIMNLTLCLII